MWARPHPRHSRSPLFTAGARLAYRASRVAAGTMRLVASPRYSSAPRARMPAARQEPSGSGRCACTGESHHDEVMGLVVAQIPALGSRMRPGEPVVLLLADGDASRVERA